MKEVLPDTATVSSSDHLIVGGCDTVELAERFGTPLLVFDRATFTARADAYAGPLGGDHVFYAGKAFLCVALCRLVDSLGLALDVCTGGELATARAAGFPPERIIFHGNNKSVGELAEARDAGVGRIVVDSFEELDRLTDVGVATRLLVRVTPGVEAHTHEYIQTGHEDSKFGFGLGDGIALEAVKRALQVPGCELVGLHAHIGSQIFELAAYRLAIQRIAAFAAEAKDACGFEPRELNVGGGLGIAYTSDEITPEPGALVDIVRNAVTAEFGGRDLAVPELFAEPGRSLVGSAGVTLYRVGTVKRIPGVRTFVSVDGGMSDNIRPALYGARYEAVLANRMSASPGPLMTIVGKHCESGDVLIKDTPLPDDVAPSDVVCVPATGAYTYALASNYNRMVRPAVVMVADGEATEIVRRETYDDLLRLDRRLDGPQHRPQRGRS